MKVTLVSKILLGSLCVGSALGVTVTVNSTAAHTVPSTLCESSLLAYPPCVYCSQLISLDGQMFEVRIYSETQLCRWLTDALLHCC